MSEYEAVGGGLKLKGLKKKKKKKSKHLDKAKEEVREEVKEQVKEAASKKLTETERKFLMVQRQREEDRLKKKAKVSHKEKVEAFNSYLDQLSEHYDIPKVSWTK